jgi:hypothetical protein
MLITAVGMVAAVAWLFGRGESLRNVVDPVLPDDTGKAASDSKDKNGGKGLKRVFRESRIEVRTLNWPFKLLIGAVFAQTFLVAVLLIAQVIPQRVVASGVPDQLGGTYVVPLADFVVSFVSIGTGYCLALAGALRVRPAAGLAIVAGTVFVLGQAPLSKLEVGGPVTGVHAADVWLRSAQLGVLALLCAWALWNAVRRRHRARGGPAAASRRPWLSSAVAATVAGAYFALELGAWEAYALAGQTAAGTGFLVDDLGLLTLLLPVVLTVVGLLYSTDLLDLGETTVRLFADRVICARPRLLGILTLLVALALIANVVRVAPAAVPVELAAGAIIVAAACLLARRAAAGYTAWSDGMRSRAVLIGALALFAYLTILPDITPDVGNVLRITTPSLYPLVGVPLVAVALAAGGYLLARGRTGRPDLRTLGLFLMLAGMLTLAEGLRTFLAVSHLPAIFPPHFSPVSAVQLAAGLAALAWTGWLLARRRATAAAGPLRSLFVLLIGLGLVALLEAMLSGIAVLSGISLYLLAGFFLILGLWGLITSGDQLNSGNERYPRPARIMLLISYTVIANAIALYLGTLRVPTTGTSASSYLTTDFVTPAGLGILGTAAVAMAFLLPGRRRSATTAVARTVLARTTGRRRIRGAAALATVLALFVIAGCTSPPTSGPYATSTPGPNCDKHGAYWSVPPGEPVSTQCVSSGLNVVAGPHGAGDVQFLPPVDSFPQNYRISVRVTFTTLTDGCVSIYTRSSSAGHYTSSICTGPAGAQAGTQTYQWELDRITPGNQWLLGIGDLGGTGTYTLQATAETTDQQIIIDGAAASGTDAALTTTKYIALGISNSGTQAGSAVFSHFAFTPLPAQPPAQSTSTAALPTTTKDKVVVWYTDTGKAELALLTDSIDTVGHAATLSAQGAACAKLATAVTTARADPQVPDPAARSWLAQALTEFSKAAANCQAGASSHNTVLSNQAAAEVRLATADIEQFNTAIGAD